MPARVHILDQPPRAPQTPSTSAEVLRPLFDALTAPASHPPPTILKRDEHTLVARLRVGPHAFILKLHTPASPVDHLKALLRQSRLWRQYRGARWLIDHRLPTAQPLAMLSLRDHAHLPAGTYLAMHALDGRTLLDHLALMAKGPSIVVGDAVRAQHALADAAGALVANLLRAQPPKARPRYNRDHKPSNLIVTALSPDHAELAIIDTVAIDPHPAFSHPTLPLRRMLFALIVEPLGCNVLPRRALLMRGLYAYLRREWAIDPGFPSMSQPHRDQPPVALSGLTFDQWARDSVRAIWPAVVQTLRTHGDPRPRINPLQNP